MGSLVIALLAVIGFLNTALLTVTNAWDAWIANWGIFRVRSFGDAAIKRNVPYT